MSIKVNGKVVWSRADPLKRENLSEEIELPAPSDDKKVPLLSIHVDWTIASYYAGVDNIYLVCPNAKTK